MPLERKGSRVIVDKLVYRETQDQLVIKDNLEALGKMVHKVNQVTVELKEQVALRGPRVLRVREDNQGHKGQVEIQDHRVLLDPREKLALLVIQEQQGP